MDAGEAEAGYRKIRAGLDAGQVTLDEYNRRVAELRYRDNTGTWWAVSPQDGSWLKWTGSAWVQAFPQAASSVKTASGPAHGDLRGSSWHVPPVTGNPAVAAREALPAAEPVPGSQPPESPAYAPSYHRPAGEEPPGQATTVVRTDAAGAGKRLRYWTAFGSLLSGILAWVIFPYILGILAIFLGGYTLVLSRKGIGGATLVAFAGTFIACAATIVEYLYF